VIVNMSSIAGLRASPYATAYGASKAAVRQLTQSVAQHCAEERLKIRCNSIHPGDIRTPLWDQHAGEMARARGISLAAIVRETKRQCPMGEMTTAEEVAAAVAYLVSDDARHITGIELVVDGGTVNCASYRARSEQPN
jgi:3(or 17)beta-hydroxysteroid dehydrogenase